MRYMTTLTFFLLFSYALAQQNDVTYINKSFSAAAIKSIEVQTSGGSIHVEGNNGLEALVEVVLNPNGNQNRSTKDLKTIFEGEYELELEIKNSNLVAKATRKNNRGNNPLSVSFRISVPTKMDTDLKTSGGSIAISNLDGNLSFATSGGSLSIKNVKGNIDGKTSGGSISASNASGTVNLGTSGGSIQLSGLEGEVNARTSGGSISASFDKVTGPIDLSTSGGSVKIVVPKGGYELNLKGTSVNKPSGDFVGADKRNSVTGKVNGGGKAINASTSGGSVSLTWN